MKWSVRKMVTTAMLAAVAGVLMSLEFSVPLMPVFYKVDFSDVPAVIALFSMGPVSGQNPDQTAHSRDKFQLCRRVLQPDRRLHVHSSHLAGLQEDAFQQKRHDGSSGYQRSDPHRMGLLLQCLHYAAYVCRDDGNFNRRVGCAVHTCTSGCSEPVNIHYFGNDSV